MEEEVLLHMYRDAWNDFLDSYKEKMNQVDFLEKIAEEFVSYLTSEGKDKEAEKINIKLKEIKNGRS